MDENTVVDTTGSSELVLPADLAAERIALVNEDLLSAIDERSGAKLTATGYGIQSAEDYVRSVIECAGSDVCKTYWPDLDVRTPELLKEAESRLVYSNRDTTVQDAVCSSCATMETYCKDRSIAELPPRTLMTYDTVVTTPSKDRDGDILETKGAELDPMAPVLWHHTLMLIVGKVLKTLKHSPNMLKVAIAVMDSQLGMDVAHLVDFGALRTSHGFLPYEFEQLGKDEAEGKRNPGYRITKYEIMEVSLVSVPSNKDAVITAFSRGKLGDPVVKRWAESMSKSRPLQVPVLDLKEGRVLSKANESRLKKASELLDEVLSQIANTDELTNDVKPEPKVVPSSGMSQADVVAVREAALAAGREIFED